MSRFQPDPSKRKENRRRIDLRLMQQCAVFEEKCSLPFKWMDTSRLSLMLKGIPKEYITSFMLTFDFPIPKVLVELKLREAFGELEKSV